MVRFTETNPVPADAKVIDHTWAKCNKDGSPDRRFSGNYQIPVAGYGELRVTSDTGLNEMYLTSNMEKASRFAEAFSAYKRALRELASRRPAPEPQTAPKMALDGDHASANATPVAPVEQAAPPYEWRSIPFLQHSDAASPQHTGRLLEQFLELVKNDIEGFSGTRKANEIEPFIRTAATLPGHLKTFLGRAPGGAKFAEIIIPGVTKMALGAVEQARSHLEAVDAETAAQDVIQSALRAAREVEAVLKPQKQVAGTKRKTTEGAT
jgi:hypothetical protein